MKICYAQLPDSRALVENQLQLSFPRGTTWIASRFDDGRLAGVAAITPMVKGNCNLHIAGNSSRWFTPEFCKSMFTHIFVVIGCQRVTASIAAENELCQRLAKHVGFQLEGRLRGFDFGDLLMYGMLKGECKWVES